MAPTELTIVVIALLGIAAAGCALWVFIRSRQSAPMGMQSLLRTVAVETLTDFIVPDGAGGEIHIDHLLLTPHGLILLETKDMQGAVFAGDRMDTWSANHDGERLTFDNPIPSLYERAAAISLLAPSVPIEARVLFTNDVTFPKGHPEAVSTVATLLEEYRAVEARAERRDFSTHWRTIKSVAALT